MAKRKSTKAADAPRELGLTERKTTPNLREETSVDNEQFFEKDYLVYLPEGDELTDELRERQINDVRQSAMQRGLRPSGDVTLENSEEEGSNVHLFYKVPVEYAADENLPFNVEHAHVSEADQAEAEKE